MRVYYSSLNGTQNMNKIFSVSVRKFNIELQSQVLV